MSGVALSLFVDSNSKMLHYYVPIAIRLDTGDNSIAVQLVEQAGAQRLARLSGSLRSIFKAISVS